MRTFTSSCLLFLALVLPLYAYRTPAQLARQRSPVYPATFGRLQTLRTVEGTGSTKSNGVVTADSQIKGNNVGGNGGVARVRRLVRLGRRRFGRLQNDDMPVKGHGDQSEEITNGLNKNNEEPSEGDKHQNDGEELTANDNVDHVRGDSEDAGNALINGMDDHMNGSLDDKDEERAANGADGPLANDKTDGEVEEGKKMNEEKTAAEEEGGDEAIENPDSETHTEPSRNGEEDSPATEKHMDTNGGPTSDDEHESPEDDKKEEFEKPENGEESLDSMSENGESDEHNSMANGHTTKSEETSGTDDVEHPVNGDTSSPPSDDLSEGEEHVAQEGRRKGKAYSFEYNTSAIVEAAAAADPNAQQAPILSRAEKSDEKGNIRGSYGYMDAQGLFRHVQYEADRNGFRAKVISNEPGLSDSSGSPANVRLMLEPVPAAIQEKYGSVGNGTTSDALMDVMHNETASEEMIDEMLDSAMGGSSGIGGINEEVIRVMTGEEGSMDTESEDSEEPSGDLTSSDDADANGHSAEGDADAVPMNDLNEDNANNEAGNGNGVSAMDEPIEENSTTESMGENRSGNDLEIEGRSPAALRLRAARLRQRMLRRYRSRAARRPQRYGSAAYRSLLKNSHHSRSRFGRRLTTRNSYFRALKAARNRRLQKNGRTIRRGKLSSRSGFTSRQSLKSRNRGALRVRRLRSRGGARRVARISGSRSIVRSRAGGRNLLQYGRRNRSGRRSQRRRSTVRSQRRTSRSRRLRKHRTNKKRRVNANRKPKQRSRHQRKKSIYFANRN